MTAYPSDALLYVSLNNVNSNNKSLKIGFPQGSSVLRPLYFSYILLIYKIACPLVYQDHLLMSDDIAVAVIAVFLHSLKICLNSDFYGIII